MAWANRSPWSRGRFCRPGRAKVTPGKGGYAGQPGKVFAKVLEELWTEVSPTGAYSNPTRIIEDNRIPAMGKDDSVYAFAAPDTIEATVNVRLVYRRAFKTLANQKGWDIPDVLMAQQRIRASR